MGVDPSNTAQIFRTLSHFRSTALTTRKRDHVFSQLTLHTCVALGLPRGLPRGGGAASGGCMQ